LREPWSNNKPCFSNSGLLGLFKRDDGWDVLDASGVRKCKTIVSTLPIPVLMDLLPDVPHRISAAVEQLVFRGLKVVLLGMEGVGPNCTAIYDPNVDTPAHRVCYNSNFSESMCPTGHWSLSAEITIDAGSLQSTVPDELLASCVAQQQGLYSSSIVYHQVHTEKYAYVVPTLGYQKHPAIVMDYLKHLGIVSCGRFAEFRYLNMDEVIANARECARKINEGEGNEDRV
jgi:protoporphyrinogen oxidase